MRTFVTTFCVLVCGAWCVADDGPSEKRGTNRSDTKIEGKQEKKFKNLTPEEREAKRAEIKSRLEKRIRELREKLEHGQLSSDEQRELARREQLLKRFEQGGTNQPPRNPEQRQ